LEGAHTITTPVSISTRPRHCLALTLALATTLGTVFGRDPTSRATTDYFRGGFLPDSAHL
jgi:hypothetical protein